MSLLLRRRQLLKTQQAFTGLPYLGPDGTDMSDATKIAAINTLYSDLQTNGLLSYFVAIYPYCSDGVNKTRIEQHRFNLLDPTQYKLADIVGGPPASDSGADYGSSSNTVQDSGILVADFQNGCGLSLYYDRKSRSQSGSSNDIFGKTPTSNNFNLVHNVNNAAARFNAFATNAQRSGTPSQVAFLSGTRENSTSRAAQYRNGVYRAENTVPPTYGTAGETDTIKVGGNPLSTTTSAEFRWAAIDTGIPEASQATFYNIVLAYQTALSRN